MSRTIALLLLAATTGCMTYRGPRGAEAVIEERLGSSLDRKFGISFGPISTKIAASFVHGEDDAPDLRGLTGVGVAVFEMDPGRAHALPTLQARDFVGEGWESVLTSRSGDDQVLILVKTKNGSIHQMMLVAIDGEEVVLARVRGDIDRLVESAVAAAERDGPRGAREAIAARDSGS